MSTVELGEQDSCLIIGVDGEDLKIQLFIPISDGEPQTPQARFFVAVVNRINAPDGEEFIAKLIKEWGGSFTVPPDDITRMGGGGGGTLQ